MDWVTGWVVDDPFSDDDQGMGGYVRFTNGIECFIHFKDAAKKGIEVVCSRGVFYSDWYSFRIWTMDPDGGTRLSDLHELEGRFPDSNIGDRSYAEDGLRVPGFRQMSGIQSIVDSLEKSTEPACPGDSMRKALEIGIALRESHRREYAPVKLPLQDRSLKIYPHEGRWLNKKEVYSKEQYAKEIGAFEKPS